MKSINPFGDRSWYTGRGSVPSCVLGRGYTPTDMQESAVIRQWMARADNASRVLVVIRPSQE